MFSCKKTGKKRKHRKTDGFSRFFQSFFLLVFTLSLFFSLLVGRFVSLVGVVGLGFKDLLEPLLWGKTFGQKKKDLFRVKPE